MALTAQELIQFAELHKDVWQSNASSIGLTSAQTTEYKNLTTDARAKFQAALLARQAAKVATQEQNEAIRALRNTNSALLKLIRGFAQNSNDPNTVYNKAEIDPPAAPGPIMPPTAAFDLTANLAIADGGIDIRWKASQPSGVTGVVYRVERAVGSQANWSLIGLTGTKSLIDTTIPAGSSRVFYRVTAQRGTLTSTGSTVLDIRFGTGPGMFVAQEVKLAA
jgi:hypothetical protein